MNEMQELNNELKKINRSLGRKKIDELGTIELKEFISKYRELHSKNLQLNEKLRYTDQNEIDQEEYRQITNLSDKIWDKIGKQLAKIEPVLENRASLALSKFKEMREIKFRRERTEKSIVTFEEMLGELKKNVDTLEEPRKSIQMGLIEKYEESISELKVLIEQDEEQISQLMSDIDVLRKGGILEEQKIENIEEKVEEQAREVIETATKEAEEETQKVEQQEKEEKEKQEKEKQEEAEKQKEEPERIIIDKTGPVHPVQTIADEPIVEQTTQAGPSGTAGATDGGTTSTGTSDTGTTDTATGESDTGNNEGDDTETGNDAEEEEEIIHDPEEDLEHEQTETNDRENGKKPKKPKVKGNKPKLTWKTAAAVAAGIGIGAAVFFAAGPLGVSIMTVGGTIAKIAVNRQINKLHKLGGEVQVTEVQEPRPGIKGAFDKFKKYIKSEEGLRDISWMINSAIITGNALNIGSQLGLGSKFKSLTSGSEPAPVEYSGDVVRNPIQTQTPTQVAQPVQAPTQTVPTSPYDNIVLGDNVGGYNVSVGHMDSISAVAGENTKTLISQYVNGESIFNRFAAINPDGTIAQIVNTDGLSLTEFCAKNGLDVSQIAVDVSNSQGVGQAWINASELISGMGGPTI